MSADPAFDLLLCGAFGTILGAADGAPDEFGESACDADWKETWNRSPEARATRGRFVEDT